MSSNTASVVSFLSIASLMASVNLNSCRSDERAGRNRNCSSGTSCKSSMCDNRLIGQYFCGNRGFFPGFGIVIIATFFHAVEKQHSVSIAFTTVTMFTINASGSLRKATTGILFIYLLLRRPLLIPDPARVVVLDPGGRRRLLPQGNRLGRRCFQVFCMHLYHFLIGVNHTVRAVK